jgi:hypothetical protein
VNHEAFPWYPLELAFLVAMTTCRVWAPSVLTVMPVMVESYAAATATYRSMVPIVVPSSLMVAMPRPGLK